MRIIAKASIGNIRANRVEDGLTMRAMQVKVDGYPVVMSWPSTLNPLYDAATADYHTKTNIAIDQPFRQLADPVKTLRYIALLFWCLLYMVFDNRPPRRRPTPNPDA